MSLPTLYSGTRNASSWAMRAWLALREAGVDFHEEVVDIRRPQRFANLLLIGRFSPPACVPVLVVGDTVIFDSIAIMEYANDTAGGALLPDDLLQRAQARSLMAWQHAGLSNICARISFESSFYPLKRPLTDDERAQAARLFRHLEQVLQRSGGPFLFKRPGLVDIMLAPTVVRLTRHGIDLAPWPLARQWTTALMERPSVVEWMREADVQPHIWFDDYLVQDSPLDLEAAAQ